MGIYSQRFCEELVGSDNSGDGSLVRVSVVSWEELLVGVSEGRQLVDMSGKGWPSVGVSREESLPQFTTGEMVLLIGSSRSESEVLGDSLAR